MAKEMIIIFVYDSQLIQHESDDPDSAILYFHPTWVSDQQRTALCGQIVGTTQFLRNAFSCPKILSLQSGKFAIRHYGRYLLAVGTDRNIADWVLEYRANTLTSLISFFHCDLQVMGELYQNSANLSAKLYHMFETYLKILMYIGNIFSNIPSIKLPKSSSNVFLEAIQILQCCQETNNVLGGTVLYHNKVVATQLSAELTKRIILTDPYRIKSPAEIADVNFNLPLGVQLLQVYIPVDDFMNLQEDGERYRRISQYFTKKDNKSLTKPSTVKEPVLSAMKRDQSLIFTTVPEEDADLSVNLDVTRKTNTNKLLDRPKFLNLRSETTDSKYEVKSETKPFPSTPFYSQTSVCSTPMSDLNKVLHHTAMSICIDPEEDINSLKENLNNIVHNSIHTDLEKSNDEIISHEQCVQLGIVDNIYENKKCKSLCNITLQEATFDTDSTKHEHSLLETLKTDGQDFFNNNKNPICKSIADPLYPVFKSNGVSASYFLYTQFLEKQANVLQKALNEIAVETINTANDYKSTKEFNDEENTSTDLIKMQEQKLSSANKSSESKIAELNTEIIKFNPQQTRKELSLPLKSLTYEQGDQTVSSFNRMKSYTGVQLTPLMSKLTTLAMEERSNKDVTTPLDYKDTKSNFPIFYPKKKLNHSAWKKANDTKLKKCVLFICGQQDMVISLLLDEKACTDADVVNLLWDKCTSCLGKLEKQLRQCLEAYAGGSSQGENGEYSYLSVDPQWDTVQRGGPWGAADLGALTHLHRDFIDNNNLTEIILRNDDSIIYGYHCGEIEVYYQHAATSNAGLPTPADAMAIVGLKARSRLERDHAIILL